MESIVCDLLFDQVQSGSLPMWHRKAVEQRIGTIRIRIRHSVQHEDIFTTVMVTVGSHGAGAIRYSAVGGERREPKRHGESFELRSTC